VLEAGKKALATTPQPQPTPEKQPAPVDVDAIVARHLQQFSGEALGVMAATTELGIRHFAEFGERLNVAELIADAHKGKVDLQTAYSTKFKPQYDAKAAKAEEARVAALRKDIEAELRQKYASIPYPVGHTQPSTLDGLGQPVDRQSDFSAAAAAAEYEQRVAARSALGG
jgi:hypothetical protein